MVSPRRRQDNEDSMHNRRRSHTEIEFFRANVNIGVAVMVTACGRWVGGIFPLAVLNRPDLTFTMQLLVGMN